MERFAGAPSRRSILAVVLALGVVHPVFARARATPIGAALEFNVNALTDEQDSNPGDGVCATASGACTLRAAVMEADAHPGQPSRVVLPAGRIELDRWPLAVPTSGFNLANQDPTGAANGDLDIFWPMTIVGAGASRTVIDANGIDRIFNVRDFGAPVSIPASPLYPFHVFGPRVEISDVTLTGGRAAGRDILAAQVGGAILSVGDLIVRRTIITGNEAFVGGAIFTNGQATVEGSTISDNVARGAVAGIRYDGGGVVRNSTFTGNRISPSCCLPGNGELLSFPGGPIGVGAAIDSRGFAPLLIENSTFVDNRSVLGAAVSNVYFYVPGQIPLGVGTTTTLHNNLIAHNTSQSGPPDCLVINARMVSAGGNIEDGAGCPFDGAADVKGTDPQVTAFGDHGGPTPTFDLRPGSPAIGRGHDCPATDQRGRRRPPAACDSGAVEADRS